MKKTRVYPDQAVGLRLTGSERKLLSEIILLDDDLVDRIKDARPDKREVPFTIDELDALMGFVAAEANHTKSKRKQAALDHIFQRIEDLLTRYTDGSEADDEERAIIGLTAHDHQPQTLERQAIERLTAFADQLEQACKASGLNLDDVLEGMTPTKIAPDETVGLNLTPTEKQMLCDLDDLDGDIKDRIDQAPKSRRKFEFTLRQINMMENAVAMAVKEQSDTKVGRTHQRLDDKLIQIQTKYICDDEHEGSLGRMLSGEPVSRGVAVRDLLIKVLEERKAKK